MKTKAVDDAPMKFTGQYFSIQSGNFDHYPPELQKEILETEIRLLKKKATAPELERLVESNPNIPEYKILLALVFDNQGHRNKSSEILQLTTKEYPDYLASRFYLGLLYIVTNEIDKVSPLFNGFVELEELFPDRTEFLSAEVDDYLMMGILYYVAIAKIAPAARRLEKLKARNPQYILMEMAEKSVEAAQAERNVILFDAWRPKRRTVEYADRSLPQLTTAPVFELPEIAILYDRSLKLTPEEINSLLNLPRDMFIRDLEKMVMDARQRYQYLFYEDSDQEFPEQTSACFLSHAVLFLTECKSGESLPVIMGLLEEDETFYFDWFSEYFEECIVPAIYQLGQHQLEELKKFMTIPNLAFYPRDAVSEAIIHIALQQPARRDEVIKWFDEVFQYFIDHRDDDGIIETDLIGSMVIYCTWIKAQELTETIKTMFEYDLVSVDFCGPFDDVEADLSGTINDDDSEPFLTIFEQYDYFRSVTDDDDEGNNIPDYQFPEKTFEKSSRSPYYKPQMPVIAAKIPGRNDPCPCGSGKKYKKCCM